MSPAPLGTEGFRVHADPVSGKRGAERIRAMLKSCPSARNQLERKDVEVTLGDIMVHVVVKIGKSQVESVITRRSAEELSLKTGDKVTVVIKQQK
jgi:molybdopterin-binding protein